MFFKELMKKMFFKVNEKTINVITFTSHQFSITLLEIGKNSFFEIKIFQCKKF